MGCHIRVARQVRSRDLLRRRPALFSYPSQLPRKLMDNRCGHTDVSHMIVGRDRDDCKGFLQSAGNRCISFVVSLIRIGTVVGGIPPNYKWTYRNGHTAEILSIQKSKRGAERYTMSVREKRGTYYHLQSLTFPH
ncbi:hypothetical protein M404DRAFT_415131 [Pisolithus tinctorius Marx 270]|uniref:Uncharacterized protein n=1 Tax=Pisolithus tinctorius Marx 270 TaxID=870435 RepID=A0A0C3NDZ5_PISTI|nr:hypothetical protein M404DRAFT_415131 [Pisolithus tinctorius Marx 270]